MCVCVLYTKDLVVIHSIVLINLNRIDIISHGQYVRPMGNWDLNFKPKSSITIDCLY